VSFGRGGDARDEIIIPLGCFRRGAVNVADVDPKPKPYLALIGKVSTGGMGSYRYAGAGAFGTGTASGRLKPEERKAF
jgi:hypothetical protein